MNAHRFLLAAVLLAAGCGERTPTSPTVATNGCANVAGVYDVTYKGACPSSQYPSQWTLTQTSCDVHSAVAADMPIVSGTTKGNAVHLVLTNGFINCQFRLEGDGEFDGRTIRAQLSGPTSGPCCGERQESVAVVAVRRSGS